MKDTYNILKNNHNFCHIKVKPWITFLIVIGVIVLGWSFFQNESIMESEDFSENLNLKLNPNASFLTNLSTPQDTSVQPIQTLQQPLVEQQNTTLAGITRATPRGGSMLIANNANLDLQNAFKQTIASVRPSVVNIKAVKANSVNQQQSTFENVGSGIIVSATGHVLTNYHVISNASRILVSVYGAGRQNYIVQVVDHHADTDLTLLKLESNAQFKPAYLGNSDLVAVGDIVLAIGNPFGLEQTVTSGIVSGIRKTLVINGITYRNMIQTDAPINRGSSGGPLTNLNGEVIGVNTAIYAPTGVFNGTGFAMPINQIKRFLVENNIAFSGNVAQGNVSKPFSNRSGWLGLEVQPVDRTIALHLGLPYVGGALINKVIKNSPAWEKGLQRGDVILEFDGRKILSLDRLGNLIDDLKPGETVKLLVFRDKKAKEFFITLA